jgi:HAD superfamily hydrolase (TIGR01457 family)
MEITMSELAARLKEIRLFLMDLDGTVYIENELIPGALDFVNGLRERKTRYVFLTNNSSKSAAAYVEKIRNLGIPVTSDNVFTSGQATALYLREQHPDARVYLVGTRSLRQEMQQIGVTVVGGDEPADMVVVGFDTELEYAKLQRACSLIDDGVPYYATHPDMVCPIRGKRYIPDCGAICQMIEHATGRKPVIFGKPDAKMVEIIARQQGVSIDAMAMVGDRLYTDIAMGKNAGITAICVLTGETDRRMLDESSLNPDFIVESIKELADNL